MALFCDAKPLIIYLMEGELETQFEIPAIRTALHAQ